MMYRYLNNFLLNFTEFHIIFANAFTEIYEKMIENACGGDHF